MCANKFLGESRVGNFIFFQARVIFILVGFAIFGLGDAIAINSNNPAKFELNKLQKIDS